jgi:hypothetical protein
MMGLMLALFLSQKSLALSFPNGEALPLTGTYSDLRFNEEAGDLLGTEIRIVVAKDGYAATLQFGEGGASDLIVVPIHFDFEIAPVGESIRPTTPESEGVQFTIPSGEYTGKFKGKVTRKYLQGTFEFTAGGKEQIKLPRKKSYWEQ